MHIIRILSFILLLPFTGTAQTLTISGKILDKETNEPLIFASIGVRGKPIGTVSNRLGEFDFHIPPNCKNEILEIRMLGYENLQSPIINLLARDSIVFRLDKAVQLLDEVIIKDKLKGSEIARIAMTRINQNYPEKPFLLEGFYRDLKKLGGTYFSLLEAAVKIYDDDYKEPRNKYRLRERVGLMEVRKSLGYNNKFTRYFEQTNLLQELLLHNDIRYRHFPNEDIFYDNFKRERTTFYNDKLVFVISQNKDFHIKLYIDTETYAIIRMEQEIFYDNEVLKRKRDLVSKYISDKKVIDFKEFNGKMYLSYMNLISKINWYQEDTDELKFETELYQELLVNKIITEPDERIPRTEKMRSYGLQYQDQQYNKAFWDNYNVIKDTPLDREIVADLEQLGALEEQFENY